MLWLLCEIAGVLVPPYIGRFGIEWEINGFKHTRDTSGTADQRNLVDIGLVDLRVTQHPFDGLKGRAEKISAKLLKAGAGNRGVEVDAFDKRDDFNGRLSGRRA